MCSALRRIGTSPLRLRAVAMARQVAGAHTLLAMCTRCVHCAPAPRCCQTLPQLRAHMASVCSPLLCAVCCVLVCLCACVDRVNCPFFFKMGACRHGDRCSRLHHKPLFSQTLLFPHMYQNPRVVLTTVGQMPHQLDMRKVQEDVRAPPTCLVPCAGGCVLTVQGVRVHVRVLPTVRGLLRGGV